MTAIRPISQVLTDLTAELPPEKICTFDLLEALHERGFGILIFIFALPAALPLPGLGINTVIALPLLFLTVQQAMGRHRIWVPEWMKYKSVSRAQFEGFINMAVPYLRRLEFLIRPRLGFVTQGVFSHLIGLAGVIMTLSICVPLPLTNTVPAFGIALMALGVVMRDGLAVIAGMVIGLIWTAGIFYILIFMGTQGLEVVKDTIMSYI